MSARHVSASPWLRLALLVLCVFVTAAAPASAQGVAKVGDDVVEALRARGEARIVIALAEPPALRQADPDLVRAQVEIDRLQDRVLASVGAADFQLKQRYRLVPALAGNVLSEAGLLRMAAQPEVARIDLDVGGTGGLTTSVPLIGAPGWHARGVRGGGVSVAVIDSGVDTDNSNLAANLIHQECFLDTDGSIDGRGQCPNGSDRQSGPGAAEDDAGHGTHVSGIVASRGAAGGVGVAPEARLVAIKVLNNCAFSGCFAFFSEVVAALDFVISRRPDVRVINMSLGTSALFNGECDASTSFNMAGASAVNTLRARGVITFASAGNNGSGTQMTSPACLRNVVSVGATDNSNLVASFSNSNATTDIMAPGVGTVSSAIGGGLTTASGTSMASPHAAGCAALFIQAGEAVTPDQIEARLKSSSIRVADPTNGLAFPRIDCGRRPPTAATITGPATGTAGVPYRLDVATGPLTTTLPLRYAWAATGQEPVTRTAQLTDSLTLAWSTPGTKTITVTVSNAGGSTTDTHTITVAPAPPATVQIDGPAKGATGVAHRFTAMTSPLTTTLPLTYTWTATDLAPVTRTAQLSDTLTLEWPTTGTKTITVTASNAAGSATRQFTVVVEQRLYLPLARR
jgi:subtilisin family serine protease